MKVQQALKVCWINKIQISAKPQKMLRLHQFALIPSKAGRHVGQHVARRNSAFSPCFNLRHCGKLKFSVPELSCWLKVRSKGPRYRRGAIKEKFITQCTVSLVDSQALPKVKTDESFGSWCRNDIQGNSEKNYVWAICCILYSAVYSCPLWPALIFDSFWLILELREFFDITLIEKY